MPGVADSQKQVWVLNSLSCDTGYSMKQPEKVEQSKDSCVHGQAGFLAPEQIYLLSKGKVEERFSSLILKSLAIL